MDAPLALSESNVCRYHHRAAKLLLLLAIGWGSTLSAYGATQEPPDLGLNPSQPTRPVSLRDRLITGLQVRLPAEIQFIDRVVENVEKGRLPQRLVDQTFFWARTRAKKPRTTRTRRRPIIYFRPALVARTSKLRIEL